MFCICHQDYLDQNTIVSTVDLSLVIFVDGLPSACILTNLQNWKLVQKFKSFWTQNIPADHWLKVSDTLCRYSLQNAEICILISVLILFLPNIYACLKTEAYKSPCTIESDNNTCTSARPQGPNDPCLAHPCNDHIVPNRPTGRNQNVYCYINRALQQRWPFIDGLLTYEGWQKMRFWRGQCFLIEFHWNFSPKFQLTISQHWFRECVGTKPDRLNQWWPSLLTFVCVTRPQWIIMPNCVPWKRLWCLLMCLIVMCISLGLISRDIGSPVYIYRNGLISHFFALLLACMVFFLETHYLVYVRPHIYSYHSATE